jgi:hypothetical protein
MKRAMRGATVRKRAKFALAGCAMAVLAALPAPAAPSGVAGPTQVDVKLVIATDISLSIDDEEAQIQRQGIADLFLDPEVVRAIQSGPLGVIAVSMLDWAGYGENKVILDWTLVNDKPAPQPCRRKSAESDAYRAGAPRSATPSNVPSP